MTAATITPTARRHQARPTEGCGIVTSTSTGIFGPLLAAMCGLPSNNTVAARLAVHVSADGCERWERIFGSRRRTTEVRWNDSGFVERFAPLQFMFVATSKTDVACTDIRLGPLPLPRLITITAAIRPGHTTVRVRLGHGRLGTFTYHATIGTNQ